MKLVDNEFGELLKIWKALELWIKVRTESVIVCRAEAPIRVCFIKLTSWNPGKC